MSLPYNSDNSAQFTGTYTTSTSGENIQSWSKSGNNLYHTSFANIGIGGTNLNTYKLNVIGSFNATSLYPNGTEINFSLYTTPTELASGSATKQDKKYIYINK
jgi:hypothetical protein